MTDSKKDLFTPVTIGNLELPNRFIMAPLTRCRADLGTNVPNALMAEYYAQRARGGTGLIISEYTTISEDAITFHTEGGIWNDAQVEGWKLVTEAVHQAGGKIFCQLAHGGRVAHPDNNKGKIPAGPSAIGPLAHPTGVDFLPGDEKKALPVCRELTDEEVKGLVTAFGDAARRAKAAGFDGIEIHGANGYLIDQFYNDCSNQRSAPYGGSLDNRSRFSREVLEQVTQVFDSGNVGYRISPLNSYQDMKHEDPIAYTEHVTALCNEFKLGYLHVMRADFFGVQKADVVTPARAFKGVLVVNMGYTAEEGNAGIADGSYDAVAFGTKILANPDFVHRSKNGEALNDPNPVTFYKKTSVGYTDYPFSDSFNSNA